MADIRRIPFTEMVERVQSELVRDGSSAEGKFKGRVNDEYIFNLPNQIDINDIRKTGSITTIGDYTTGTVALTNGSTTVTGTDTVFTSANSNNCLFKADSWDEVYRVTYSAGTTLVLDRVWVETTDTSDTYRVWQDRYSLASDFGRMVQDPKAVYYWSGGNRVYLTYKDPDKFEKEQSFAVGTPCSYTIKFVSGSPYMFVDPPDDDVHTIEYNYIPSLARMTEYTTGTITTLANGGTAVTGDSTAFSTYVSDTTNYKYYFRIDSDGTASRSAWYRITSAGSATALTLTDAYEGTAIAAGTSAYTISKCSLLPAALDLAIIYGAAIISAVDQESTEAKNWAALYRGIIDQYRGQLGRENYGNIKLRPYSTNAGARR